MADMMNKEQITEEAKKTIGNATERARETYETARSSMRPLEERVRTFATEQPLAALGAAVAFGFFLGRMIRGSMSWSA